MEVRTYRARTMQEALRMVRDDLGPQASVLHTREVRGGLLKWFAGRQIEVTASLNVRVPSRLAQPEPQLVQETRLQSPRRVAGREVQSQVENLQSLVEELRDNRHGPATPNLPENLFHLFTSLIDAEVSDDLARELIDRVRAGVSPHDMDDVVLLKARIARMVEDEIAVSGPIQVKNGQRRLVALVGPTGVGKTTTIAKLAANYHLREKRRVGLITVDTYRIAAVEQLRTYADIIDLPMEVVSTPKEMRAAVERFQDLDLVLMDTAGRSPRDEVKIQELKSMLSEAEADEVHLVLSSVSSAAMLRKTAEKFTTVGTTSLVLTKLDEATGLGNLLPLLRSCRLPLSYLTNGQNVPEDIEAADQRKLARIILGMQHPS